MQNRGWMFMALVVVLFSCRKEADPWDREGELETDSTFMIYGMNYLSNTSTQLVLSIDILGIEDLKNGTNYSSINFSDQSGVQNVDYTVNSVGKQSLAPTSYSSVLLFNLNGIEWYRDHYVGFNLRRFFEIVDYEGTNKIAFSTCSGQQNLPTTFQSEMPGDIFGNSWEYNVKRFYELTEEQNYYQYQTSVSYLRDRIEDIIDSMNVANATGDKSITLLSNIDFLNYADTSHINAIVNKANSNNVRINLIGLQWPDQMQQIANKTGGFISEYQMNYNTNEPIYEENDAVTHVAVTLQNLDDLLSRKVKVHHAVFQFDFNDASVYLSGDRISYPINYKGLKFYIDYYIP